MRKASKQNEPHLQTRPLSAYRPWVYMVSPKSHDATLPFKLKKLTIARHLRSLKKPTTFFARGLYSIINEKTKPNLILMGGLQNKVTCISELALIVHINIGQIFRWVECSRFCLPDHFLQHPSIPSQVQHIRHLLLPPLLLRLRKT